MQLQRVSIQNLVSLRPLGGIRLAREQELQIGIRRNTTRFWPPQSASPLVDWNALFGPSAASTKLERKTILKQTSIGWRAWPRAWILACPNLPTPILPQTKKHKVRLKATIARIAAGQPGIPGWDPGEMLGCNEAVNSETMRSPPFESRCVTTKGSSGSKSLHPPPPDRKKFGRIYASPHDQNSCWLSPSHHRSCQKQEMRERERVQCGVCTSSFHASTPPASLMRESVNNAKKRPTMRRMQFTIMQCSAIPRLKRRDVHQLGPTKWQDEKSEMKTACENQNLLVSITNLTTRLKIMRLVVTSKSVSSQNTRAQR